MLPFNLDFVQSKSKLNSKDKKYCKLNLTKPCFLLVFFSHTRHSLNKKNLKQYST